jgi:hypothetical protein
MINPWAFALDPFSIGAKVAGLHWAHALLFSILEPAEGRKGAEAIEVMPG